MIEALISSLDSYVQFTQCKSYNCFVTDEIDKFLYLMSKITSSMDPIKILIFGVSPVLNSNFSNLSVLYIAVSKATYIVFCIHYLNF